MDGGDWRAHVPPDARQRIVNYIMDTLKRVVPVSGPEQLHQLRNLAERFEEKHYSAATSRICSWKLIWNVAVFTNQSRTWRGNILQTILNKTGYRME
ncbi:unnamed protein product, partial [Vitis vinifera]